MADDLLAFGGPNDAGMSTADEISALAAYDTAVAIQRSRYEDAVATPSVEHATSGAPSTAPDTVESSTVPVPRSMPGVQLRRASSNELTRLLTPSADAPRSNLAVSLALASQARKGSPADTTSSGSDATAQFSRGRVQSDMATMTRKASSAQRSQQQQQHSGSGARRRLLESLDGPAAGRARGFHYESPVTVVRSELGSVVVSNESYFGPSRDDLVRRPSAPALLSLPSQSQPHISPPLHHRQPGAAHGTAGTTAAAAAVPAPAHTMAEASSATAMAVQQVSGASHVQSRSTQPPQRSGSTHSNSPADAIRPGSTRSSTSSQSIASVVSSASSSGGWWGRMKSWWSGEDDNSSSQSTMAAAGARARPSSGGGHATSNPAGAGPRAPRTQTMMAQGQLQGTKPAQAPPPDSSTSARPTSGQSGVVASRDSRTAATTVRALDNGAPASSSTAVPINPSRSPPPSAPGDDRVLIRARSGLSSTNSSPGMTMMRGSTPDRATIQSSALLSSKPFAFHSAAFSYQARRASSTGMTLEVAAPMLSAPRPLPVHLRARSDGVTATGGDGVGSIGASAHTPSAGSTLASSLSPIREQGQRADSEEAPSKAVGDASAPKAIHPRPEFRPHHRSHTPSEHSRASGSFGGSVDSFVTEDDGHSTSMDGRSDNGSIETGAEFSAGWLYPPNLAELRESPAGTSDGTSSESARAASAMSTDDGTEAAAVAYVSATGILHGSPPDHRTGSDEIVTDSPVEHRHTVRPAARIVVTPKATGHSIANSAVAVTPVLSAAAAAARGLVPPPLGLRDSVAAAGDANATVNVGESHGAGGAPSRSYLPSPPVASQESLAFVYSDAGLTSPGMVSTNNKAVVPADSASTTAASAAAAQRVGLSAIEQRRAAAVAAGLPVVQPKRLYAHEIRQMDERYVAKLRSDKRQQNRAALAETITNAPAPAATAAGTSLLSMALANAHNLPSAATAAGSRPASAKSGSSTVESVAASGSKISPATSSTSVLVGESPPRVRQAPDKSVTDTPSQGMYVHTTGGMHVMGRKSRRTPARGTAAAATMTRDAAPGGAAGSTRSSTGAPLSSSLPTPDSPLKQRKPKPAHRHAVKGAAATRIRRADGSEDTSAAAGSTLDANRKRKSDGVSSAVCPQPTKEDEAFWRDVVVPQWALMKGSPFVRTMFMRAGVPASLRAVVWSLCIGNALNVTWSAFFASLPVADRRAYKHREKELTAGPSRTPLLSRVSSHGSTTSSAGSDQPSVTDAMAIPASHLPHFASGVAQQQSDTSSNSHSNEDVLSVSTAVAPTPEASSMMPFGDNSFRSGAGDALSHANRSDFDSDEEEERMLDAAIFDEEHVAARGAHRARRESIEADMGRMFPAGPSPGAPAQTELRMVLEAFCVYRPSISYVQGMSYLASVLLHVMNPFAAFVALVNLTDCEYYRIYLCIGASEPDPFTGESRGGGGVEEIRMRLKVFGAVFKANLPSLYRRFKEEGLFADCFMIDWCMTMFSKQFPFPIVARVWDGFFLFGEEFVFRSAVALLTLMQNQLAQAPISECMRMLISPQHDMSEGDFVRAVHAVQVPRRVRDFYKDQTAYLQATAQRLAAARMAAASAAAEHTPPEPPQSMLLSGPRLAGARPSVTVTNATIQPVASSTSTVRSSSDGLQLGQATSSVQGDVGSSSQSSRVQRHSWSSQHARATDDSGNVSGSSTGQRSAGATSGSTPPRAMNRTRSTGSLQGLLAPTPDRLVKQLSQF